MGESHENLLKAVRHYQESLDKYTENRNDGKLLHYLERLYKLPIKVIHLEQTGVGRTVNGLRKLGGEVGDSAKSLVAKWKEMVVGEQEEEEDEDDDDEDEDEDGYQTGEEPSNDSDDREDRDENVSTSSHRKSDNHRTDERSKVKKSRHESDSSKKKDKHKHSKHNGHTSSSSKHKSHKRRMEDSSSDEESSKKCQRRENSSDDEDRHKPPQKKKLESDSEEEIKSKEKKHRSDDEKKKYKSSDYEDLHKSNKSKDKNKESSSKDKHKSSKKEEGNRHEHSKKSKDKDRKSESSKPKESYKNREKSEDKKHKSSKSKSSNSGLSNNNNGIDSGSGASFAEALGMCEPSSSSKTSTKKKSANPEKKEKIAGKVEDSSVPKLLKEPIPPEPLDINLSSLLPTITPNYRPLGSLISSEAQPKKYMSDYEALSNIITSKNQRTKVYSGNKMGIGKVPSLFELCIRILQDNIDALEYTGGVPYTVLKPILEKSNPNQLYSLEHHNPYLIEDTDELWQLHCQKEFRNKKREEFESWREMYLRCLDERDAKLKALTANIKQAQDKSLPVRTTKLAYVDAVAKPPRNIARKQAKNGTAFDRKPAVTPAARLSALATAGEAGKVAVPNPGARAVERTSSHPVKPKKAPLMLKSISSFKNRFKR